MKANRKLNHYLIYLSYHTLQGNKMSSLSKLWGRDKVAHIYTYNLPDGNSIYYVSIWQSLHTRLSENFLFSLDNVVTFDDLERACADEANKIPEGVFFRMAFGICI